MNESKQSFTVKHFIARALDPIHIGTGGERIGRVDQTVVREPSTNVPKIPGTSLSGALKFFLDLSLQDSTIKTGICASTIGSKRVHNWETCPVCYAFGYTPPTKESDKDGTSAQGIVQFTDAQLFAFPVHSMVGPVWITTKPLLKEFFGVGNGDDLEADTIIIPDESTIRAVGNKLNLGWAYLDAASDTTISIPIDLCDVSIRPTLKRLVILPEWLFSQIVNDNMEVRTSVAIDSETGAAIVGALFTYEAVPRGALFGFDIVENDYRGKWKNVQWNESENNNKPPNASMMLAKYAFPGIDAVGLGGMTTRGFGRMMIVEHPALAKKAVE